MDLSVLKNLQSLSLRHHNINSICDTLAQFTRPTFQILTIDILPWKLGFLPYHDCGKCSHSQLATKLGTLIGGPVFKRVPAIHLRVGRPFLESPDLVEALTYRREHGSTQVSAVDSDGYMVDSMHTLANHILSRLKFSQ